MYVVRRRPFQKFEGEYFEVERRRVRVFVDEGMTVWVEVG